MQKTETTKWNGKSRGGSFGYLFFVKALRVFGVRFAYFLILFVAFYFIFFAPKATAASWNYHRQRLGYGRLKSAVKVYWHLCTFAKTIVDKLALRIGLANKYCFEYTGAERFLELINSGTGVVMIGAHVGCWEAGAQFFGKYGKHINIVMLDDEHKKIKEVLDKNSLEQNYKIIPVNQDIFEIMVRIRQALSSAEIVCFNGDRYIKDVTTKAEIFLGGKAKFPEGPFRIASKCHVPVVFYYAMRESGQKYHFIFEEVKDCSDCQKIMEQYIQSLENIVRKYPEQWFNFYQFWEK
ncbi:MAG: acyltransferase [Bacteroidales bacterium]|nr:acyltransferase [Bacteroidales bacterium]